METRGDLLLRLVLEATGGNREDAADAVVGALAERYQAEWREVVRVMTLARGDGFEDELPDDMALVGLGGDPHFPQLLAFSFPDVGVDYVRVQDGAVVEVDHGAETTTLWAPDGERVRTVDYDG